jgi:hypothetical protein
MYLYFTTSGMMMTDIRTTPSGAGGSAMATTQSQLEQPLVQKLLDDLLDGVPRKMDPGTVIALGAPIKNDVEKNPYVAIMACPRCGLTALITHRQVSCKDWMICGSLICSAEWRLIGEHIFYREVQ